MLGQKAPTLSAADVTIKCAYALSAEPALHAGTKAFVAAPSLGWHKRERNRWHIRQMLRESRVEIRGPDPKTIKFHEPSEERHDPHK
jgi:hypothetical protein